MCLSAVPSDVNGGRYTTNAVLPVRDRFKMRGVDAIADAAEVVKVKAIEYWSDNLLICDTMGETNAPTNSEPTISGVHHATCPQPATAVRLRRHVPHEPL